MNTANATATGDPVPSCGSGVDKGVWYTFTPSSSGLVTINTCGSSFDTVLQVYTGACGSLSSGDCNDDNGPLCQANTASMSFNGTAGTVYRILVGGFGGTSGTLSIVSTVTPPPSAPTANAPTSVTSSGFTANWSSAIGATGYRLDMSTSSTFGSFVSEYQDLDVGNVTSRSVNGLSAGTTYYYRVRAHNSGGTSGNSGTITVMTTSPTLSATRQGSNLILTWSTNTAGFSLEYITILPGMNWTPASPAPVVVGGQNVVTNTMTGVRFYQLKKP